LSASSTCATAIRAEHDRGLAGRGGLRRALVEAALGRGDERADVDPAGAGRGGCRAPGGVDLGGDEAALLERDDAARRGDRDARGAGAQLDGEAVAGGRGELARDVDRLEREHGRIPAVVCARRRAVGQAACVVRLAVELGVHVRGRRRAVEAFLAQVGGGGGADASVAQHDELRGLLHDVRDPVLADRQPPLPPDRGLALGGEALERPLGEGVEVVFARRHRVAEGIASAVAVGGGVSASTAALKGVSVGGGEDCPARGSLCDLYPGQCRAPRAIRSALPSTPAVRRSYSAAP